MNTLNELIDMSVDEVFDAVKAGSVDKLAFMQYIDEIQEFAIESAQEGIEIDLFVLKDWANVEYPEAEEDWDKGYESARKEVREML